MNVYGKDQRIHNGSRTKAESWVMHSFTAITGLQASCIAVCLFRMRGRLDNVLQNSYFITSPLQLNPVYHSQSCALEVNEDIAMFRNVTYTITGENVEYFFSRGAFNTRILFFLVAMTTFIALVNHTLLWLDISKIRYHFVVIRKDPLAVFQVSAAVAGIFQNYIVSREHKYMNDYLNTCNAPDRPSLHSVTPFIELYLLFGGTLVTFLINFLIAVILRCQKNPKEELIRENELMQMEKSMTGELPFSGDQLMLSQRSRGDANVSNSSIPNQRLAHSRGPSEGKEFRHVDPLASPTSQLSFARRDSVPASRVSVAREGRLSRGESARRALPSQASAWPPVSGRRSFTGPVSAPAFDDIIGDSTHR
ncbi:uncharacterized protein TEOVI_000807700 [Trypanosoma equiperdum]|uniref:Uncharacterized protein n=3 Tax=Trypanozoon TaxID=39700 RepID=Q38CI5_TRYB2|nr:hypothetical protein, conserved [Trypanosoma brucei brucei TREU927]EAN77485.1 hypothetical protein, conserved [Trypanosoma brucei brucei TREU927]SCU66718.1 hypothetical protein, conserved [Trypanosoma equiperdum]